MKSFRFTLWTLVVIVFALFLWAATLPSELRVRESKTYQSNAEILFAEISDLNEWQDWFPWMDEGMELNVTGTSDNVGQSLEWSHPEHGEGRMECTKLVPDSLVCHTLQFDQNSEILSSEMRIISKHDGSTEIIWEMTSSEKYAYPLGRIRAFAIRKMSSSNMTKGLNDLSYHYSK